jgi:hypothetical protein
LPPVVVNVNLPHDSFFWLGPSATVAAALLALGGAITAYRAVKRQIDANAKNVQDQIDAAADQQRKNRDAEWARMRRDEVLDLLEDAGRTARKLANAARTYSLVAENPELFDSPEDQHRQDIQEFPEITANALIVVDRLKLHGLTTVSGPLVLLEIEAGAVIRTSITAIGRSLTRNRRSWMRSRTRQESNRLSDYRAGRPL